ncbi:hypothetical protein O3M35_008838 [Rhynocoris fuscipes]|uniref:CUB domain-containing protein n=1 Tax=Rhynocoris fuscipes TaxID=488301 RepID=A0AAW1D8A8_9HEMI
MLLLIYSIDVDITKINELEKQTTAKLRSEVSIEILLSCIQWICCSEGDYVRVYLNLDRPEVNEQSPWTGLLCGSLHTIPPFLYSAGSILTLELHTSSEPNNSTGFQGTFRFIDTIFWTVVLFNKDGKRKTPVKTVAFWGINETNIIFVFNVLDN